MKKYMILTSVLALAACGGGSHHHHSSDIVPDLVEPEIDFSGADQSWNGAPNSTVVANSGRVGDTDLFVFNIDGDGNIGSVVLDGHTYTRNGSNNEYVYTEADKTSVINLATMGKSANLQYADFGFAQETERKPSSTDRDFYVFTGGRNTIENPNVTDATYTGTAIAYIEANMPGRIANQLSKTNEAKLVVDANGNRELSMNFSKADKPWYDVVVKGNNIELKGGDNVADDFKVPGQIVQGSTYVADQFYGDGTPTEVTYRVGAEYKDAATNRELEFDAAFGGKR